MMMRSSTNAMKRTLRAVIAAMLLASAASAMGSVKSKDLRRWIPGYSAPPAAEDPIGSIEAQMKDVGSDLAAMKTDSPVQARQQQVVASLDVLIKELEQQCKGSGGGSNPNPTKPMNRSIIAKGPGGSGPLHDAAEGTRVWGQLPPRERERILQSQTEGFPPGYESVLANYYRRLAQEQVVADGNAGSPVATPATQPAP